MYRRKLSWTCSILLSFLVIGAASEIASPFMGIDGENAVSGVITLMLVGYWVWSYRRGRFPIIRVVSGMQRSSPQPEQPEDSLAAPVPSDSERERADFLAWRAARAETLEHAELAEFRAWKAAQASEAVSPPTTETAS